MQVFCIGTPHCPFIDDNDLALPRKLLSGYLQISSLGSWIYSKSLKKALRLSMAILELLRSLGSHSVVSIMCFTAVRRPLECPGEHRDLEDPIPRRSCEVNEILARPAVSKWLACVTLHAAPHD